MVEGAPRAGETMDTTAERFALIIVGVWVTLTAIQVIDPSRPVPTEIYPALMLALGYVFGRKMIDKGTNE